ncbi:MAG: hypothetical protein ACK559_39290, partial [bacterium]
VYGNADLIDVPWETLIKAHRKKLGGSTFEKLEDYANSFLSFLQESPVLFSEDTQQRWLKGNVTGYYALIRDELFEEVQDIIKEKGEVRLDVASETLLMLVAKH